MIRPPFGEVLYADGTKFSQEPIQVAQNGWVYKPDRIRTPEEIKRGKNKVWPREEGYAPAQKLLKDEWIQHFNDRKWEVPVATANGTKLYAEALYGDALTVTWVSKQWGWAALGIRIYQDRQSITVHVMVSDLAAVFLTKNVDRSSGNFQWEYQVSDIPKKVRAFISDPWKIVMASAGKNFEDRFVEVVGTPPDLRNLEYADEGFNRRERSDMLTVGEIKTTSAGNGRYYQKGVIEQIFEKDHNWKALNELFDALRFIGISVKPNWSYRNTEYSNRRLSGIEIYIPEQEGMSEHSIYLNSESPQAKISCGYQNDEDKWIERKQREAVEQFAELTRDLSPIEYEIEL